MQTRRNRRTGARPPSGDAAEIVPIDAARPAWDGTERRTSDRRSRPTRPFAGMRGPFRRRHGRRESDQGGYVDLYSRREVALILFVFLMNVCDAFLTMLWLERGGHEANPVMAFFLDIGPGAFLLQKCFIVGLWLVVLLVHKNFRFARIGLYASLVVYALLMIVHFGILAFGVSPQPPRDPSMPAIQYRSVPIEEADRMGAVLSRTVARPEAE